VAVVGVVSVHLAVASSFPVDTFDRAEPPGVVFELASPRSAKEVADLVLSCRIKNNSKDELVVCKDMTFFWGLLVTLRDAEGALIARPYKGKTPEMPVPQDANFMVLRQGHTLTRLLRWGDFLKDLPKGRYSLQARYTDGDLVYVPNKPNAVPLRNVYSNTIMLDVTGRGVRAVAAQPPDPATGLSPTGAAGSATSAKRETGAPEARLTLKLLPVKATRKELKVVATLTNVSDHGISVYGPWYPQVCFYLYVKGPGGEDLRLLKPPIFELAPPDRINFKTLEPGKSSILTFEWSKRYFWPERDGVYEVSGEYGLEWEEFVKKLDIPNLLLEANSKWIRVRFGRHGAQVLPALNRHQVEHGKRCKSRTKHSGLRKR
jgi:hypothetical protein